MHLINTIDRKIIVTELAFQKSIFGFIIKAYFIFKRLILKYLGFHDAYKIFTNFYFKRFPAS